MTEPVHSKYYLNLYSDGTVLAPETKLAVWLGKNLSCFEKFQVKNSLRHNVPAWQKVTKDKMLLGVVQEGYVPDFLDTPAEKLLKITSQRFKMRTLF